MGGGQPFGDSLNERAVWPRVGLLATDDQGLNALGGVLADAEAEPPAPRDAEEMGILDAKIVEDRHRIGDAQRQRVGGRVVRLAAAAVAGVVDIDGVELVGGQRLGDRRGPHQVDRLSEPTVDHAAGAVDLVVHLMAVQRVLRVRPGAPLPSRRPATETHPVPVECGVVCGQHP